MESNNALNHRTGNTKSPNNYFNKKNSNEKFETFLNKSVLTLAALEMLVEISNLRASLLHAHDQVQSDLKAAK